VFENRSINKNWRDEAIRIKDSIFQLKDTLLNIEVELMEDADNLLKKEILVGIDENIKRIGIILNEEQKDEKNDETGYLSVKLDSSRKFKTKFKILARSWNASPRKKLIAILTFRIPAKSIRNTLPIQISTTSSKTRRPFPEQFLQFGRP
jgi:hypothetical protein